MRLSIKLYVWTYNTNFCQCYRLLALLTFNKREMSELNPNFNPFSDWKEPNETLKKAAEKYKQRELLKEIMKDDENDGLYDKTFNTKEK